jgi:CHASE2 domain-containing sensor protein
MMIVYAALVAAVFGTVGREGRRESLKYGLKIFGEFVAIGFILAWLLYWLPF